MSRGTLNDLLLLLLLLLRLLIHLTRRCRYGFLRILTSLTCIFIFLGRSTRLFLNSARPRSGWRRGVGGCFRLYLATSCGRSVRDSSSTISRTLSITLVTSVSLSTFLIIEIPVFVSRSSSGGGSAGTDRTRSSGRSSSSRFSSSVSSTSRCRWLTCELFLFFVVRCEFMKKRKHDRMSEPTRSENLPVSYSAHSANHSMMLLPFRS